EPLAGGRRPARRRADEDAATAAVPRGPDEVADPLEPEHRVEEEDRERRDPVPRVRGAGGEEGGHRPRLRDPLLEDLAVLRLAVVEEGLAVDRLVELADGGVDPELAEERLHPERPGLVRDDRHDPLPDPLVLEELREE